MVRYRTRRCLQESRMSDTGKKSDKQHALVSRMSDTGEKSDKLEPARMVVVR
ncbi:hypothetical protein [Trichococcus shcherbakoviae]|uniref:hypothetical protein n=1 Tax=Trichococcus shcherbakoviae TaxID=2094020 RepID=UPI002AA6DB92|nr:hypothetical protein [Trichococcus shcherbakoviae]